MLLVGFSAEAVLAMSITVAMTWWANNWETKNCGRRELPSVGGLEFIWVAVMMCTLAAFGGIAAFAYEILGVEVKTLIYAGTLFFLVYAMQKNLAHTRNRLRDFAGPLASVGPIAIWYLASLAQDGTAGQGDVALLAIGLIGTKHAGDLMRHLWMAKRYSSFDLGFSLPAGLLLVVGLAGPGGGAANVVEWVILLALLAIAAGKLVYQAIDTYRCLSGTVIELK